MVPSTGVLHNTHNHGVFVGEVTGESSLSQSTFIQEVIIYLMMWKA
jgi:hypothetical protein